MEEENLDAPNERERLNKPENIRMLSLKGP